MHVELSLSEPILDPGYSVGYAPAEKASVSECCNYGGYNLYTHGRNCEIAASWPTTLVPPLPLEPLTP